MIPVRGSSSHLLGTVLFGCLHAILLPRPTYSLETAESVFREQLQLLRRKQLTPRKRSPCLASHAEGMRELSCRTPGATFQSGKSIAGEQQRTGAYLHHAQACKQPALSQLQRGPAHRKPGA